MDGLILDLVGTVVTVIALLFTGIQVLLLVSEIRQNKKWNTQNAAFNYCMSYSELEANIDEKCINSFLENLAKATPDMPVDLKSKQSKKAVKDITIILQYFERLSVGLVCGYFDEEVVRRVMNRTFVETYNRYRPYIEYRRKITSSKICSHFDRVANTWENIPVSYPYRTVPSAKKHRQVNS